MSDVDDCDSILVKLDDFFIFFVELKESKNQAKRWLMYN